MIVLLSSSESNFNSMKYLNQFHKESAERKMQKITESMKSPMNSTAAAAYMKANFEKAKSM